MIWGYHYFRKHPYLNPLDWRLWKNGAHQLHLAEGTFQKPETRHQIPAGCSQTTEQQIPAPWEYPVPKSKQKVTSNHQTKSATTTTTTATAATTTTTAWQMLLMIYLNNTKKQHDSHHLRPLVTSTCHSAVVWLVATQLKQHRRW